MMSIEAERGSADCRREPYQLDLIIVAATPIINWLLHARCRTHGRNQRGCV